jgi:hypothetical protein
MALVWQYGDLPWLADQLVRSLWLAVKAAYGNRDTIWQAVQTIHEKQGDDSAGCKRHRECNCHLRDAGGCQGRGRLFAFDHTFCVARCLASRSVWLCRLQIHASVASARRAHATPNRLTARRRQCGCRVALRFHQSVFSPSSRWPLGSLVTGAYSFCWAEVESDPHDRAGGRPYEPLSDPLLAHRNTIHAHPSKRVSGYRSKNSRTASWPPWITSIRSPSFTLGPSSSTRLLDMIRISETLI